MNYSERKLLDLLPKVIDISNELEAERARNERLEQENQKLYSLLRDAIANNANRKPWRRGG